MVPAPGVSTAVSSAAVQSRRVLCFRRVSKRQGQGHCPTHVCKGTASTCCDVVCLGLIRKNAATRDVGLYPFSDKRILIAVMGWRVSFPDNDEDLMVPSQSHGV